MRSELETRQRRELLEQLRVRLQGTHRRRSPVEAPLAFTGAYVDYLFAYGSTRLGDRVRAKQAGERARAALHHQLHDVAHAYLCQLFEWRIEQALAGEREETPRPQHLLAMYEGADRVGRYKIDRLCEYSNILAPTGYHSAIEAHSRRARDHVAVADPDARQAVVEQFVVNAAAGDSVLLAAALRHAFELPATDAKRFLVEALVVCESVPEPKRPALLASALRGADYFDHQDLIATLTTSVHETIALADDPDTALAAALPVLVRRGDLDHVRALLTATAPGEPEQRVVWAGAAATYGDHASARKILAVAVTEFAATGGEARLAQSRRIAIGLTLAPFAMTEWAVEQLLACYASISDSWGTNSHYCLSAVNFVESLVLATL